MNITMGTASNDWFKFTNYNKFIIDGSNNQKTGNYAYGHKGYEQMYYILGFKQVFYKQRVRKFFGHRKQVRVQASDRNRDPVCTE